MKTLLLAAFAVSLIGCDRLALRKDDEPPPPQKEQAAGGGGYPLSGGTAGLTPVDPNMAGSGAAPAAMQAKERAKRISGKVGQGSLGNAGAEAGE